MTIGKYSPKEGDMVVARRVHVPDKPHLWHPHVWLIGYTDRSSDTVRMTPLSNRSSEVCSTNFRTVEEEYIQVKHSIRGMQAWDHKKAVTPYKPTPAPVVEKPVLWEILVPTVRPTVHPMDEERYFKKRYHQVWDQKVREIAGGLTIMGPVKGQWVSPSQELFIERMIPVRILSTKPQIEKIVDLTLEYYNQEAVLCYKVSDEVILKYKKAVDEPKAK